MTRFTTALAAMLAAALAGCATTTNNGNGKSANAAAKPAAPLPRGLDPLASRDPFPSTYRALPGRPTAIVGANVFDGAGKLIEGPFQPGDRVVVIEDTVTTGSSARTAAAAVRAAGAEVIGVLALVDREEGGREALAADGLDVLALATATEIVAAMDSAGASAQ